MNISIEQLKNLIMKYDVFNGEYPESMYEGLSVYEFILQELGIPSDIPNDRFNIEYFNLMSKTFGIDAMIKNGWKYDAGDGL